MNHVFKSFESADIVDTFYFKMCLDRTEAKVKLNFYPCQLLRIGKEINNELGILKC